MDNKPLRPGDANVDTMGSVVWQTDGWNVARRNALLILSHGRGVMLTAETMRELGDRLRAWARDPELYALLLDPTIATLGFEDVADDAGPALAELIWRLECFSKPTVTVFDGAAGDVGWALALAGTHRGVGREFMFRSVAASRGRLPPGNLIAAMSHLGESSALDAVGGGHVLRRHAAVTAALATHAVDADIFGEIINGLVDAEPVDPLFDDRALPLDPIASAPADSAPTEPIGAGTRYAAQAALAGIVGQPIDRALSVGARWNEALRLSGADAPPGVLESAFDRTKVDLPSRRTLQAFRAA